MVSISVKYAIIPVITSVKVNISMDYKAILGTLLAVVVIVGGIYWFTAASAGPDGQGAADAGTSAGVSTEESVAFAQCLTDAGATFYGAFWCPHCDRQKALFGEAAMEEVDYVECAIPGNRSAQTQACQEANIQTYPTWEFADGSRTTGVQSFEALSEKTSCPLPGEEGAGESATTTGATSSESGENLEAGATTTGSVETQVAS